MNSQDRILAEIKRVEEILLEVFNDGFIYGELGRGDDYKSVEDKAKQILLGHGLAIIVDKELPPFNCDMSKPEQLDIEIKVKKDMLKWHKESVIPLELAEEINEKGSD